MQLQLQLQTTTNIQVTFFSDRPVKNIPNWFYFRENNLAMRTLICEGDHLIWHTTIKRIKHTAVSDIMKYRY